MSLGKTSAIMTFNAVLLFASILAASLHSAGADGARVRGRAILQRSLEVEAKPPRGWREFNRWKSGKEDTGEEEGEQHFSTLQCGVTVKVTSKDEKNDRCPIKCPYYAQDRQDSDFCTFACVANAAECQAKNPETTIADKELGICRKPMVQNCKVYVQDGTDTCKVCQGGYRVGEDGKCHSKFHNLLMAIGIFLVVICMALLLWVIDLCCRPVCNEEPLLQALEFRSCQKLRMSKRDGRCMWPLTTNLLRQVVAGVGMRLHFNFQMAVIIWGAVIAVGWLSMALTVDHALLILGTRRYGTPRNNCILVAWGWETQQRLMWTKVGFLAFCYVFTFIGSILFSIYQLRVFQDFDYQNKTMKDFVGVLEGLPKLSGRGNVEEDLKNSIVSATGQPVVGVSVAWNFQEHEELFIKYLEKDMVKRDPHLQSVIGTSDVSPPEDMGLLRRKIYGVETRIFLPEPEQEDMEEEAKVHEALLSLNSSKHAFVVFETEAGRDMAVKLLQETGGLDIAGEKVFLKEKRCEPDTVVWEAFGHVSLPQQIMRLFKGFFAIFLALIFWSVIFYAPYAWSVFSFNYDNGQQPGMVYSLAFSMVVVIGNQIMYEVCSRVSDNVGFRYKDNKMVCYMILFTVSCTYNVMVDMVTTYFMAEQIMTELGFRTYFGVKLEDVPTFTERFESYPLQRALAENTYQYAFPSTYVIPFVLEPLMTIYFPLMLGIFVVGSHSEIRGRAAEQCVAAVPIDMGRYADIVLNMVLAVLIFYFPGGYTHWLFFGLAGAHLYIFLMDHCRLLRAVPSVTIATMDLDWCGQLMTGPVSGILLACMVFKANCRDYGFCFKGNSIIGACSVVGVSHVVVQALILIYVVPLFSKPKPAEDPCSGVTFRTVAEDMPCSWFTTNPVHCLRSQHIHKHNPPCRFWFSGKEHLLEVNHGIGCHFHDSIKQGEDFTGMSRALALSTKAQARRAQ